MMDGVSTMDTGSNRAIIDLNVESIAEVKVLVSNYQAEFGRSSGLQITAVTKSGTNRFRGSVYDVERNSDWNANSKTNMLNGDPKTVLRQRDWGYSIGGPIGKPGGTQQAVLLLHARSSSRAPAATTSSASGCRRRSSGRATSRRSTDNNGQSVSVRQGSAADRRLHARPVRSPASTTAACSAGFPASMLYQTGLEHPEDVADAEHRQCPGAARPTTSSSRRPTESILSYAARDPARLSADAGAPRELQVLGLHPARAGRRTARFPAGTTRRW